MLHRVFTTSSYTGGMYEGPIKAVDYAGSEESPILRQLRWTDLVARIAATRELRPTCQTQAIEPEASFAAFHRETAPSGQQPVNRDALSDGKLRRIVTPDTANSAENRDRETR